MSGILLRINWGGMAEYVSLNLDAPPSVGSSLRTRESWDEEGETVEYTVFCSEFDRNGSRIVVKLEYAEDANPDLRERNDCWGSSKITITPKSREGKAEWSAKAEWIDVRRRGFSGKAKFVEVLDDAILDGDVVYENVSRAARPNQRLVRKQLMEAYGKCALTGEPTQEVLDVAHIVEVGKRGATGLRNCMLLRTDLHRLFDCQLLGFTRDGEVVLSSRIKGNYVQELRGKRLDPNVVDNLRDALEARNIHS